MQKFQNNYNLSLEDYKIQKGQDGKWGQVEVLAHVLGMFKGNAITKMYLNNCGIDDGDMRTLITGIMSNRSIKSFELANNKLSEAGMSKLCDFFTESTQIKSLILSRTKTTIPLTNDLCQAMSDYKELQELRLNNFTFGQEAIKNLTSAVESSTGL